MAREDRAEAFSILSPNNHTVVVDDLENGTYSVSVALLMACSVKLIVNMDKDLPGTSGELPPVGLVFVTAKRDAVPSTPPSAAEEVDEVDVPRADTRRNSSAAAARRNSSAAV